VKYDVRRQALFGCELFAKRAQALEQGVIVG